MMRKLTLFIATCTALVAFGSLSAPAFADHLIERDCDGDPYSNNFAVNGFGFTFTDNRELKVAGLNGSGVSCGTIMHNSFSDCGPSGQNPPQGLESLADSAAIESPPRVSVNPSFTMANGSFVGFARINVAACIPFYLAYINEGPDDDGDGVGDGVGVAVRVDDIDECRRENNDLVGGPTPGVVLACYRADDVTSAISLGHGWIWATLSTTTGRWTQTIGPFHAAAPAGITKIHSFMLCDYAGSTDPSTRDCGDSSQPMVQMNGVASAPDCNEGQGPEGIYTVVVTNKRGERTDPATTCAVWTPKMKRIKAVRKPPSSQCKTPWPCRGR